MKHSERLGAIDRTSGDNIELRIRNTAKDTMRFRFVFCFVCLFFFCFFFGWNSSNLRNASEPRPDDP